MISLFLLGLTIGTFVNKHGSYKMLVATSITGIIETTFSFPYSIALLLTSAGLYGIYCISSEYISEHQPIKEEEEDEGTEEEEGGEEGDDEEEEEDELTEEEEEEEDETEEEATTPDAPTGAPVEAPTGSTGSGAPIEAPTGSTGSEAPIEAPTGSTGADAPIGASPPTSPSNPSSDMSCDTTYDDMPPLVEIEHPTYLPTFQYD